MGYLVLEPAIVGAVADTATVTASVTEEISRVIITSNLRFLGATLVHVVSSASIGFMIGLSFYRNAFVKVIGVIIGVILATVLHASFNLAIINATEMNTLKVFGWVWFAVVILLILFEEIKSIRPKGYYKDCI